MIFKAPSVFADGALSDFPNGSMMNCTTRQNEHRLIDKTILMWYNTMNDFVLFHQG